MSPILEVNDWRIWGVEEALTPSQWVALSARFPPNKESFAWVQEETAYEFWDSEQGLEISKREVALKAAIKRNEVHGMLDDGRLLSSGFMLWAWAEDIKLPDELRQVMRPRMRMKRAEMFDRYSDVWEKMKTDFSHSNENGLALVASLVTRGKPAEEKRVYQYWDEDAAIYWARREERMPVEVPQKASTSGQDVDEPLSTSKLGTVALPGSMADLLNLPAKRKPRR